MYARYAVFFKEIKKSIRTPDETGDFSDLAKNILTHQLLKINR